MTAKKWTVFICIGIVFVITIFKGVQIHKKNFLTHDESITFLANAANEMKYFEMLDQRSSFTAEEIKKLYFVNTVSFSSVAKDMGLFDIHPPLYYFSASILCYLFGPDVKVLLWFNVFLGLLSLSFLYKLAKSHIGHISAYLVIALWSLTPVVLYNGFEARHYMLFELLAFIYLFIWLRPTTKVNRDYILSSIICVMGLLTHYYFALVVFSVGTLLLVKQRNILLKWIIYHIASLGVIALVDPYFLNPILTLYGENNPESIKITESSIITKIKVFIYNHMHFFSEIRYVIYAFLLGIPIVLVIFRKKLLELLQIPNLTIPFAVLLSLNFVLYILTISPSHAVSNEYFCFGWGLLCILIVFLLKKRATVFLIATVLCSTIFSANFNGVRYVDTIPNDFLLKLSRAKEVQINTRSRGYVSRIVWLMPDQCQVKLRDGGTYSNSAVIDNSLAHEITVGDVTFHY